MFGSVSCQIFSAYKNTITKFVQNLLASTDDFLDEFEKLMSLLFHHTQNVDKKSD